CVLRIRRAVEGKHETAELGLTRPQSDAVGLELEKNLAAVLEQFGFRRDDNASFGAQSHRVLVAIAEELSCLQRSFDHVALTFTDAIRKNHFLGANGDHRRLANSRKTVGG